MSVQFRSQMAQIRTARSAEGGCIPDFECQPEACDLLVIIVNIVKTTRNKQL
jgi:hypothetical protein